MGTKQSTQYHNSSSNQLIKYYSIHSTQIHQIIFDADRYQIASVQHDNLPELKTGDQILIPKLIENDLSSIRLRDIIGVIVPNPLDQ